jgi:hypothetical protein
MPFDSSPSGNYASAVEFSWVDPNGVVNGRYTSWSDNLIIGTNVYSSEMTLAVQAQPQTGNTKDAPFKVTMRPLAPLADMCRPYPHARVTVTIRELDPVSGENFILFKGYISKVTKNASGFRGLVQAEVSGWKSLIQYPIGMQSNEGCIWALGDNNCCVDRTIYDKTGVITDVTNNVITASVTPHAGNAEYWQNGFIRVGGLSIAMQSVSGSTFTMRKAVPPEWEGKTAVFGAGCSKRIQTCRSLYNNEQRFMGLGIRIPYRNPLYDTE